MTHRKVSAKVRSNAKSMRKEMTEAELKLWNELRAKRLMGLKFRRQMPMGNYIVDFACPDHRLIVEVDGVQHAESEIHARDKVRTRYLENTGWSIIRFWNDDVLHDIDNCCSHILAVLSEQGVVFDE